MAHNTSGLPPLDIEPFDPAPLYAAANSPERRVDPARERARSVRALGLVLALAAEGVVAAVLALG